MSDIPIQKYQNKKLGQVFLKDKNILDKIIQSAAIQKTDTIVEIGCGEGVLTQELVQKAKEVIVFEFDKHYLDYTQTLLSDVKTLQFVQGDILKTGFGSLNKKVFRIIANIPYQISSGLLSLMQKHHTQLGKSVLMVQKEFADKLAANPGEKAYSALSIFAQFYFETKTLFPVSKNCFTPIPKVDSAVISILPRKKTLVSVNTNLFFSIVKAAFWGRRKPLSSSLLKSPYLDLPKSIKTLPFFDLHNNKRGEVLSIPEFAELTDQIESLLKRKNNS
ncbi:ribosomal RNA small subunit methyltransferase A [Candidatus Marinamargulisbacteria bacterium SCGC AG-439-L15]|nr:ribosomal RNA small subunit methyltransferase A [Candidatus Marinamargulisbacteria bacterium SCGC AG-439-L15]